MNVILITNQKGGVGKTTLVREIGIELALTGQQVLLVDLDPQGNLTKSFIDPPQKGLYDVFENNDWNIVELRPRLKLLAGDVRLSSLEKRYLGEVDAHSRLRDVLDDFRLKGTDFVLIDPPPNLGLLTINAMTAARWFIVPLRPAMYSLQGTNDLLASVEKVRKSLNSQLELLGVVINDWLEGPVISREIKTEIQECFDDFVFDVVISRSVKVEEAIASRLGLTEANEDDLSKPGKQIQELTRELLARVGV